MQNIHGNIHAASMAGAQSAIVGIRSVRTRRILVVVVLTREAVPCFPGTAAIADLDVVIFVCFDPPQDVLVEIRRPVEFYHFLIGDLK